MFPKPQTIPVDILRLILDHVDKADLLTICLLNKICCSCSQGVLYRDIKIDEFSAGTQVCRTLSQSTHLARRVRSFDISYGYELDQLCYKPELSTSFQNMIFLRSLSLYTFTDAFSFLGGCTFKLVSFTCFDFDPEPLQQFLLDQPSLTYVELGIYTDEEDGIEFGAALLPNLTRVTAKLLWLAQIVPDRPVNEVSCIGCMDNEDSVDSIGLSFLTRSTTPIQKFSIDYTYLYPKPGRLLALIFPSLTHLDINDIRPTLCIVPNADFIEWVKDLLTALVSLRVFHSDFYFDEEDLTTSIRFLSLVKEISDHAPKLEYVGVFNCDKHHYGKRVSGEWVLCDESEFSEAWPNMSEANYY